MASVGDARYVYAEVYVKDLLGAKRKLLIAETSDHFWSNWLAVVES